MRARPTGRRAGATAWWGNNLCVGTCFARMPSCCVNAVSWLQASFGSPNLRGRVRFQPSQGTHQSLTFLLQNSFQVLRNPLRKGGEGLTLQLYRPIPGISIKMSPERARACKLAFQMARRVRIREKAYAFLAAPVRQQFPAECGLVLQSHPFIFGALLLFDVG